MDQPGALPVRNKPHSRQVSSDERKRVTIQRRSTRGPLDLDDAPIPPVPEVVQNSPPTSAINTDLPKSPIIQAQSTLLPPATMQGQRSPSVRSTSPARPQIDLSFLLQPTLYNPMPPRDVAAPFINSKHQPAPDTPLNDLISRGFFRHAADRAADDLTSGTLSPFDHETILQIYQIRLSCLILASRPDFAAQEARPLLEWVARNSGPQRPNQERQGDLSLIPWDLRLLLQRLQTLGTGDSRRGVMALYTLGSECRAHATAAQRASDTVKFRLWTNRLSDIGLRVASELVSMHEYDAALRHLDTLTPTDDSLSFAVHKALLYLRVGNVDGAETTLSSLAADDDDNVTKPLLTALVHLARGSYDLAIDTLTPLHAAHPHNELVITNLAVCYMYVGEQEKAHALLSLLVEGGEVFPALLFNLVTMYELRTERAVERKMQLAEQVAEMGPSERGWERLGGEFKL
ncbi:hypothetical protein MBLNU457_6153t1 [Dothideomycetes sp. NU457]